MTSKDPNKPRKNSEGWSATRPFKLRSTWALLAGLACFLVIGLVLYFTDFIFVENSSRTNETFDGWVVGLMGVAVIATAARIVMLMAFPNRRPRSTNYSVMEQLVRECLAMAQYALERGRSPRVADIRTLHELEKVPGSSRQWSDDDIEKIHRAHRNLAALVAPAMPKTLTLLRFEDSFDGNGEEQSNFAWLGNVRLARMLLGLALTLVPLFVGLALAVGTRLGETEGLLGGDLVEKTQTALYLVVAASIGATFAALFKVRRYIENLSYDDQYEPSYWMRFVLGVVAGLILAVAIAPLLPPPETTTDSDSTFRITVPLLALLGGFSSDLVYRVLQRLIEAVDTLLQGSAAEQVDLERQNAEARLKVNANESQEMLRSERVRARQAEAQSLWAVFQKLPLGDEFEGARAEIASRVKELLGDAGSEDQSAMSTAEITDDFSI